MIKDNSKTKASFLLITKSLLQNVDDKKNYQIFFSVQCNLFGLIHKAKIIFGKKKIKKKTASEVAEDTNLQYVSFKKLSRYSQICTVTWLAVCGLDNSGILFFLTDYLNTTILSFSLFCMPLSDTPFSVLISMILSIKIRYIPYLHIY